MLPLICSSNIVCFIVVVYDINLYIIRIHIYHTWTGTATPSGLGGLGIESRWGSDPFGTAMGPTQSPQWVPRLFPGVKRPGRDVDHPPLAPGPNGYLMLVLLCM